MEKSKEKNKQCSCTTSQTADKLDIAKTTICPYCGIKFETSRELLVHIFYFHST